MVESHSALFEPELRTLPPRALRPTSAGVAEVVATLGPIALGLGATSWLLLARPWTLGLGVGLCVLSALGLYLLARILKEWRVRIELIQAGAPVAGVVIEKRRLVAGLRRYRVWYTVDSKQWSVSAIASDSMAEIGDAATVLIRPQQPQHSVIYRASRWTAAEGSESGPAHTGPASLGEQP
jgi:hypothetical protein